MSQCVPSWDLDDYHILPYSNLPNSLALDVPSLDYEVAELTWENGQLAMHGLGPRRLVNKPAAAVSRTKYASWDKPRAGAGAGTLESIVNQATFHVPHPKSPADGCGDHANELAPGFDRSRAIVYPGGGASVTMTVDALVPCDNNDHGNDKQEHVPEPVPGIGMCVVGSSTRVGSCSGATAVAEGGNGSCSAACAGVGRCKASASVSESTATCRQMRDSRPVTAKRDARERELGGAGFTPPSLWSEENTSSGNEYAKTTSGEDHDSVCYSRPQKVAGHDIELHKRKAIGKSSVSTKRSRAAAIHNQSERKRRDKINERMKTLQKLVPNSSKTDKASMLDEVIEYLKQLQAQVQMMSRMNMPQMMLPLALQQHLRMSMMGMGMGAMDFNRTATARGMPPVIPPATFMPIPSWDIQGDQLLSPLIMPDLLSTFSAYPMNIDAYSRLAALYQQFQQPSGSKN